MGARRRRSGLLYALLLVAIAVPLEACLLIVSSGPTPLHEANIVFVVFDDTGTAVSDVTLIVRDTTGDWGQTGQTGRDGLFKCRVGAGVSRVTVRLEPPRGYVPATGSLPMVLDVESGGSQRVELRVTRSV